MVDCKEVVKLGKQMIGFGEDVAVNVKVNDWTVVVVGDGTDVVVDWTDVVVGDGTDVVVEEGHDVLNGIVNERHCRRSCRQQQK